jgi:hypothetical protein
MLAAGQARAAFGLGPYQAINISGWARAVAVGDVNGDGRDDIVASKSPSGAAGAGEFKVFVFYQNANGTLSNPVIYGLPTEVNANALALGDFNGDGVKDIVIGHYTGITLLTTTRSRPQSFRRTKVDVGGGTTGVDVADVDGDRKLDVIAVGGDGGPPTVYFGDGMGNIRSTRAITAVPDGMSINVADLNRDGLPDLVTTNPFDGTIRAVLHDRTTWFNSTASVYDPGYPTDDVALGDFNQDGRQDIATRNPVGNVVSVYYQNPTGALFVSASTIATASQSDATLVGDLDGDGLDDLVVQHDYAGLGYYLQGPSGLASEVLVPATTGGTIPYASGLAMGDINGDGCKDVVLGDYSAGVVVFHSHECIVRPDLSVALASSASTVTVNLANSPGTESINAPLVRLDLSVSVGTLATGSLPAGCAVQAQTATRQRIECLVDTMAADTRTALVIPVTATGNTARSALVITASASTDTREKTLTNNQASLRRLLR